MIGKVWKFGLNYRATWESLPEDAVQLLYCHRRNAGAVSTSGIVFFNTNHRHGGVAYALRVVASEFAAEPCKYRERFSTTDFIIKRDCYQLGKTPPAPGQQPARRLNVNPFFERTPPQLTQDELDCAQVQQAILKPVYSEEGLPEDWIALHAALTTGAPPDIDVLNKYKQQLETMAAKK